MTTETPAPEPAPRAWSEHTKRLLVAIGLALLIAGALVTHFRYVRRITAALEGTDVLVTERLSEEPRHVLGATVAREALDSPILKLEIPRNKAELIALTPPSTHAHWKTLLWVDLILIAGYILLFLGISLGAREQPTLWERIGFCGIATGVADCVENAAIATLLLSGSTEAPLQTTSIALLPVLGALKWLLFFLTCRAICIELETLVRWRWMSVWLRATSTAGSWAALLALLGLPTRPMLALMAYASGLVIAIISVRRLLGVPAGDRVPDEERGPAGVSATAS